MINCHSYFWRKFNHVLCHDSLGPQVYKYKSCLFRLLAWVWEVPLFKHYSTPFLKKMIKTDSNGGSPSLSLNTTLSIECNGSKIWLVPYQDLYENTHVIIDYKLQTIIQCFHLLAVCLPLTHGNNFYRDSIDTLVKYTINVQWICILWTYV